MSHRLNTGGRLIDRTRPLGFSFNGKPMRGFAGDTVAAALLGEGQVLVGRSFKYHRPRGVVAAGPEEPNALVNLGVEGKFEPNQRATTTELFEGLLATSQNINRPVSASMPASAPQPPTSQPPSVPPTKAPKNCALENTPRQAPRCAGFARRDISAGNAASR